MKYILCIFVFVGIAFSAQIEVRAKQFQADENSRIGRLDGDVILKSGDFDVLYADHAKVYFNKNKKATKYLAYKNAKFKVKFKDKSYDGSANEISYEPLKELYTLNGSAFLHEIESDKKLYGDKIVVDKINNIYSVYGAENQPVKFIFELEKK